MGEPLQALNERRRHNFISHTLGYTMDSVRPIVRLRLSFLELLMGNNVCCSGLVFWSTCLENQRVRDGCNHSSLLLLVNLAWLPWSGVFAVRVTRPRALDCSGNVCVCVTLSHLAMNAAVMLLVGNVSDCQLDPDEYQYGRSPNSPRFVRVIRRFSSSSTY